MEEHFTRVAKEGTPTIGASKTGRQQLGRSSC
jgi:hypothetical protein